MVNIDPRYASASQRRRIVTLSVTSCVMMAVVVVLVTLLIPRRPQHATVAARVASSMAGRQVRWRQPAIVLNVVTENPLQTSTLYNATRQAAEAWNRALTSCSVPRVLVSRTERSRAQVRRDGVAFVIMRSKRWCRELAPERGDCYEPTRAAITHLYPVDESGARYASLYEADVEFNGVHFSWSLDGQGLQTHSLRAAVMHELGHVLGLDHACDMDPGRSTRLGCDASSLRAAVMYPFPVEAGRDPVLVPHPAEVDALCRLYAD